MTLAIKNKKSFLEPFLAGFQRLPIDTGHAVTSAYNCVRVSHYHSLPRFENEKKHKRRHRSRREQTFFFFFFSWFIARGLGHQYLMLSYAKTVLQKCYYDMLVGARALVPIIMINWQEFRHPCCYSASAESSTSFVGRSGPGSVVRNRGPHTSPYPRAYAYQGSEYIWPRK